MAILSVEEIYERYVKPLSARDRLRLIAMIADDLSREWPDDKDGVSGGAAELERGGGPASFDPTVQPG